MVVERRRRRDSDELSDTTSELASGIRNSSTFASQTKRTADSTLAQAAGGEELTDDNIAPQRSSNRETTAVTSASFIAEEPEDDTNSNRKTAFVLMAVVAIVIAIAAVFLSTRSNSDKEAQQPSIVVDQVIQEVSSNAALRDRESPQSRAREWMISVDQLTTQIVDEGVNRIHQRYALATLYFATDGANWNRSSSFTALDIEEPFQFVNPKTSECEWFGVLCASDLKDDGATTRRYLQDSAVSPMPLNLNNTVFGLIMPNRNLSGSLPSELGTISYMRRIDLSSNQLKGAISDTILGKMKDLWWLDLSDNHFTGSIPQSLWRLPKLSHLFLFRNRFSGKIEREPVAQVASMPTAGAEATPLKPLIQVYLYENQLSGPMPPWFHELNSLEDWVSYRNQLTGKLPTLLPEKLSFYDLSFNRFTGTMPDSLWATFPPPPLETLYLEHNLLTGPIPNTTEPQPFLKLVSLHNNRLSGRIPEGFVVAWTNLKELRLQNNTLSGPIPPTFWRNPLSPSKLTHLNLGFNDFSGTLPNSTERRNLEEVRLHQNPKLRGRIPDRFGYAWPNLTALEIQGTSLEGQLGPAVTAGEERTGCPAIWPLYSEVATSFRVSSNCLRTVENPEPPVQCDCCTICARTR